MSRRKKTLSEEDRILWSKVARSAVPLKGHSHPEEPEEPFVFNPDGLSEEPKNYLSGLAMPQPAPRKKELVVRKLDEPTRSKLAKGRLEIHGRIDLHGLTQDEAYGLLLAFLHRAYASGQRYVLVITGKGSSGEGVLRRSVPKWFSTPPFRSLVGSFEDAARHHGGHGAMYVRLRKRDPK